GRRTIWRDVQRLLPGTVLEYDASKDTVTEQTYWRAEEAIQQRQPLSPERKEALVETFRQGGLRGYPESGRVGLSLSGGLDSRVILAAIASARRDVSLQTAGLENCMDKRVGAKLAAKTGYAWHFDPLSQFDVTQYADAMRRYVYLAEGMMVPDGYPG